jgi:predicted P-loop ATPase
MGASVVAFKPMILCPNFVKRLATKISLVAAVQTVFIPGLKADSNWVGE